jgi:hypothetical protein
VSWRRREGGVGVERDAKFFLFSPIEGTERLMLATPLATAFILYSLV